MQRREFIVHIIVAKNDVRYVAENRYLSWYEIHFARKTKRTDEMNYTLILENFRQKTERGNGGETGRGESGAVQTNEVATRGEGGGDEMN